MAPQTPTDDEVLRRYDRYLQEFLEALNICPYSRNARESNRLTRGVLRGVEPTVDQTVAALHTLMDAPPDQLDVGALIVPDISLDASRFSRFVGQVRGVYTQVSHPPGAYFLVAMHPGHATDLTDAQRAVAFMRRTPHPTIQVARASVIAQARGRTPPGQEPVTDRVARLGWEAVMQAGPEAVEALLLAIAQGQPTPN